ncbi:retrovirus-related pol polyprotein from transposon TNT 1-94 [Tanacetum coccineum]
MASTVASSVVFGCGKVDLTLLQGGNISDGGSAGTGGDGDLHLLQDGGGGGDGDDRNDDLYLSARYPMKIMGYHFYNPYENKVFVARYVESFENSLKFTRSSGSHFAKSEWDYCRLIAQGYNQQEGINYDETFAPVARLEAFRIFLAYATYMNFIVYQMDIKSAFLNGKLIEKVYVEQPPSFESSEFPNHDCKLDKALHRLKQAPRA